MLVKPATTSTVVEPDRTIDDTLKSNLPLSLCTFAVDAFPTSKKLKDPVTPEILNPTLTVFAGSLLTIFT